MADTEALLAAIPKLDDPSHTRLMAIGGRPPDLVDPPTGCSFSPRCPYAQQRCREERPELTSVPEAPGHSFACFYPVGSPETEEIRVQIEEATSDYDREKLQERVAKLAGGVAVIKVGAATEVEMKEKKARVEDALHATRAAVEEGIVAGGGVALLRARQSVGEIKGENADQDAGIRLVLKAIEAPLREIVYNAGGEPSVVVNAVLAGNGNYGFNAANDTYGDMIEMGILDPNKVTRTALQNAASVASLILTTEAMVAEAPKDETPAPAGGGMGGMGGMGMDM